jgi:hypothetical protein
MFTATRVIASSQHQANKLDSFAQHLEPLDRARPSRSGYVLI